MSATRSRTEELRYRKHLASLHHATCLFCSPPQDEINHVTEHFFVLRNTYGYSVWDGRRVADHLLIVPKQHIDSLSAMSAQVWTEFHALLSDYEQQGYSLYARAPGSTAKTLAHQHSHLIKTDDRPLNYLLWLRRPWWRVVR